MGIITEMGRKVGVVTGSRCWVPHYGVPRATMDGQPTRALLDLYIGKKQPSVSFPSGESSFPPQFLLLSQSRARAHTSQEKLGPLGVGCMKPPFTVFVCNVISSVPPQIVRSQFPESPSTGEMGVPRSSHHDADPSGAKV